MGSAGQSTDGPLVAPGTYTVKLTANGQSQSQEVTVVKDPNTPATLEDAMVSSALSYRIYTDANRSAKLINQIEWSRRQLEDTRNLLVAASADKSLARGDGSAEPGLSEAGRSANASDDRGGG